MTTAAIATLILVGLFLGLVLLRVPVVYSIGIACLGEEGMSPAAKQLLVFVQKMLQEED